MTSKSDATVGSPIAVRLQIINYDPRNSSDNVNVTESAAANASGERDGQTQKLTQHKKKRRRGYKHDENATVYISHEDLDFINSSISTSGDDSVLLSDGATCRLSNTNSSQHHLGTTKHDAQERSILVSGGIDGNMIDHLWAPVILRVLSRRQQSLSFVENTASTKTCIAKGDINDTRTQSENDIKQTQHHTPTILVPPCISATIGIHWFCRNNTQMMTANLQHLPRIHIVEGSSATVREIGRLSPLMMDTINNNFDYDDDKGNSKASNSANNNGNNATTEEERQLRQFFLSKRQDANSENEKHLHPSCRNATPMWKPRQRLLTMGSIFATPVITTYCDCYNRMFHGGNCKESIGNVRLYQVVDIQSAEKNDNDDDIEGCDLAYIVSPLTHLILQPPQADRLNDTGYTWRLPRPSFILSYLRSTDNDDNAMQRTHELSFGCVSTSMSTMKPNAIYHPSAKSLADAVYLQGVVVTNDIASHMSPRIINVVGESENNVRNCIDEAADMMGMRSLHVGGLAAFLMHYNSIYNRDDTRSVLTGGLLDKLKGLDAALKVANQCSPCILHIEGLDHELTPTKGQMADASGREEEERRILQVIRENTSCSPTQFSSMSRSLSPCAAPKVIVVFSTLESLPPGPISASLQQTSVSVDPPDTNYARALWDDDVDGTFEPLSSSLKGLSASDISYLRLGFRNEWCTRSLSDELEPISVLEPLLKELEASRSFTQPSRKGGAGGSSNLPLATSSLPNVRWEDVGGMENIRKEIMDAVELPLKYPQFFQGSQRSGILLFGPPGTGKTMIAKATARECGLPFLSIKGPELLGSYVGESEANIRAVFDAARSAALHSGGSGSGGYSGASVLFFDELDSLAPRRGDTGFGDGVMDRVVSTLLGELDGGGAKSSKGDVEARIIVMGATNRPDLLDPSLLRPGRFDRLLYLGPAKTKDTMLQILKAQTRKFKFEQGSDSDSILRTAMDSFPPTLSGADLSAVATKALMRGLKRVCDKVEMEAKALNLNRDPSAMEIGVDDVMETWSKEQLEPVMCVEDFVEAAKSVVPSISQKDLDNFEKLQQQFASR